jgi:hypothetical protein
MTSLFRDARPADSWLELTLTQWVVKQQDRSPSGLGENAVTLEWPTGAYGQPLAIWTGFTEAAVFRSGGHEEVAEAFVRFLVGNGWLEHWLDFAGDRARQQWPGERWRHRRL